MFICNKNLYDQIGLFIPLFMSLTEPMVTVDGEVVVFDGIVNMQDNPGQNNGNKTPPGQTIKPIKNPPVLEQPRVSEGQPNFPTEKIRRLEQMFQNLGAWLSDPNHEPQKLQRKSPRQP